MRRTALLITLLALGLSLVLSRTVGGDKATIIIDTDAGSDDLMALAYLLSLRDLPIEAVTVVNGRAHVDAGASAVARVVALSHRRGIRVFAGAGQPIAGQAAFPATWRQEADGLGRLPRLPPRVTPPLPDAVGYLVTRLADRRRPLRILTLGPLTNIALSLGRSPDATQTVEELVAMAGAFTVPGNAFDEHGQASPAEWNVFVDPHAARIVLKSGLRITLVPLDATSKVPIDASFAGAFHVWTPTPLGGLVEELLARTLGDIHAGRYYAWDPLAAVAFADRGIVSTRPDAVEVVVSGEGRGQTRIDPSGSRALVAYTAEADRFRRAFLDPFVRR